ncbi:MAG: hypothetical protein HY826_06095 [Actinobacteria bacterium]|nr:hypothetical protein [Actinomycetota bacterium]
MSVQTHDALEADRFWPQAAAAAAWRQTLTSEDRHRIEAREAEVDAAFADVE